jgi:SAM-dependent methyltransferase
VRAYLGNLGLVDVQRAEQVADRVRDRDGFTVWRCPISGVIFLEGPIETEGAYYRDKHVEDDPDVARTATDMGVRETLWIQDDLRRAEQFADRIRGKVWLDFGAGDGGLVHRMMSQAREALAFEVNDSQCRRMRSKGIHVVDDWRSLPDGSLDLLTLFHVFEHLPRPVELIGELARKVKSGGTVIVEVPHAKDFLMGHLDCDAFRRFTFWSEHLILHTRSSLEVMLGRAGLGQIAIQGYQRYPLSNHLYWLRHGQPGGHEFWGFMDTRALTQGYAAMLANLDQTDTLIAVCRKLGDR